MKRKSRLVWTLAPLVCKFDRTGGVFVSGTLQVLGELPIFKLFGEIDQNLLAILVCFQLMLDAGWYVVVVAQAQPLEQ